MLLDFFFLSQTHIRTFYIPNKLTTKIKPRMCRLPFKYFPDSIQVKAKHKSWEKEARKQGHAACVGRSWHQLEVRHKNGRARWRLRPTSSSQHGRGRQGRSRSRVATAREPGHIMSLTARRMGLSPPRLMSVCEFRVNRFKHGRLKCPSQQCCLVT